MTTKPLCAFPDTMPDITLNVFLTLHTQQAETVPHHLAAVWQ